MVISELEKHILGCILAKSNLASGYELKITIKELVDRDVSFGALYVGIERLAKKGFVDFVLKEGLEERGARPQRFFYVNAPGKLAFEAASNRDIVLRQAAVGEAR